MNTITGFSPLTPNNLKKVIEKHLPDTSGHVEEIGNGHIEYASARIANYKVFVGRGKDVNFIQAKLEDNPHSSSLTITPITHQMPTLASVIYRIYSPTFQDEHLNISHIKLDKKIPELFQSHPTSAFDPDDYPLIANLYSASIKALEHVLEGFEFVNGSVQKELVK